MNANERFEIKARAFQLMTGMMAPGKDCPAAGGPINEAVRDETWHEWREFHAKIIAAMITAFEEISSPKP